MKDLVKYIAQALVDSPDEVAVSEVEGEQTSVIELRVAKEDLGKVMKAAMAQMAGKVQGKEVSEIARKLLS